MFARFQVPLAQSADHGQDGLIEAAQELSRGDQVTGREEVELSTLLDWFEAALEDHAADGLSWFKSSADQHLAQAHDLAAILEHHGYKVTMITTDNPGEILYEDDHQVVAEK